MILERDKSLVNIQTQEGHTPVHAAASNNFMEVASILLIQVCVSVNSFIMAFWWWGDCLPH